MLNDNSIVREKQVVFTKKMTFGVIHKKCTKKEGKMFNKKKHWTKSKNINSKRYKNDLANYLDGKSLKCVTERINGIEEVIGHKGAIIRKEDELLIYSSQDVLLRAKITDLQAWELLSLEGVVITVPDAEREEGERTVVAYYSYWRNLED